MRHQRHQEHLDHVPSTETDSPVRMRHEYCSLETRAVTHTHSSHAFVIAESDADWGGWVEALSSEAAEVSVIMQRDDEPTAAFAARVRGQLVSRPGQVAAAALVGGARWDSDVLSARSAILRTLTTRMLTHGEGQVFLDEGRRRQGPARFAMRALASVVEEMVGDDAVVLETTRGPVLPPRRVAA
jgi:hypothetical protein